jgi:radical SAM superfamily enzyme YgiQ (UPF0313 family)
MAGRDVMKVLLIQPIASAEAAYPLGLATMIPGLLASGVEVYGADEHFDSIEEIIELARTSQLDWIGATVVEHNSRAVGRLIAKLRVVSQARVFVAGMWPTIHPSSALRLTGADIAIVGNPEQTVVELVHGEGPVSGTAFRREGKCEVLSARERKTLAELPAMDREVFPLLRYSYAMRSTATPYAMTFTSRGCRRSCPYCPGPAQHPKGFEARPASQIVDEFESLVKNHGIKAIHIEDDAFLTDRERVVQFCAELLDRAVQVKWELVNGIRPEHVDEELLRVMAEAGCSRIVYSFEHLFAGGHSAVGVDIAYSRRVARLTREAGIRVAGYFIVGLPGCSFGETARSVRAALALDLDDANFIPFHPIPGSDYWELYEQPRLSGRRSHWMAVAASAAFFLRPRTVRNLTVDLRDEPKTAGALGAKAVELFRKGGPVPVRDMP